MCVKGPSGANSRARSGGRARGGVTFLANARSRPTDLQSDDRAWIPKVWLNIIRGALGLRTRSLPFEYRPAIGRVTISSPTVMRPLAALNEGKPYGQQLKPFNFLLTCHVRAFGHPSGADPERFHLIAPYESDPE